MIVEDDAQIRENVAELLTLRGFLVETASNGREGISQALLQPPDLILCDVMMPGADGYQVLEVVRSSRALANLPFIFLTAKTEMDDLRQGLSKGADDHLTKPFILQNLLSSIENRLQREALRKATLQAKLDSCHYTLALMSVHAYNASMASILGFASLLVDRHHELDGSWTLLMAKMIYTCGLRLKRLLGAVDGADYCIRITSQGRPFDEANRTQIDLYRQLDRRMYEPQDFGLGLWLVHKLLELSQGRLIIEGPAKAVTSVTIWVPIL